MYAQPYHPHDHSAQRNRDDRPTTPAGLQYRLYLPTVRR